MSKNFIEPWQKMMSEWQKAQTMMTEQTVENIQQWGQSLKNTERSSYSNNPLLDIYQSFIEKAFNNTPLYQLQPSDNWNDFLSSFPGVESLAGQLNELMKDSQNIVSSLKKDFISELPDDGTREYFLKTLENISTPHGWLKFSSAEFDEGVKRFSEGPLFSGISDIDNRIAKVMDGWLDLGEKNNDYYEVQLKSWMKAYELFLEQLSQKKTENSEKLSPKKLVELWSSIADQELMKMHRSKEFLQAQKQLIKASTKYRLYEQEVAETICEALHIPTRKEVDDLHKTVTELRREVRSLKQQAQKTPSKSGAKKPPLKKKASNVL